MSKTTSTTPHSWPLITVGATVFECVFMQQKQLRLTDSIDFSSREKCNPNKLQLRYTHAHTSMLMITPTTNANSFWMSMRSLSLGFSLKHTHMHIHYPLCERVYRSVLGPILLWCLTFSLHQSCETNPLSHTHAVHLKACLQKHPLNSWSILYAIFQQKNLPVIQFI